MAATFDRLKRRCEVFDGTDHDGRYSIASKEYWAVHDSPDEHAREVVECKTLKGDAKPELKAGTAK